MKTKTHERLLRKRAQLIGRYDEINRILGLLKTTNSLQIRELVTLKGKIALLDERLRQAAPFNWVDHFIEEGKRLRKGLKNE